MFAARVVYDLLFYFIVIIIVLNLIFGVIIDTFADLRSEKQKKEEILKTTCFICGKCSQDTKIRERNCPVERRGWKDFLFVMPWEKLFQNESWTKFRLCN